MEYLLFGAAIGVYLWQLYKIERLQNEIADLKRAVMDGEMEFDDMMDEFDFEEAWWSNQPPGLWREDPDAYQRWKDSLH